MSNRYQKRLTRPIHEVGLDQNHAIKDDGERAMSNDNNYISHENEDEKHSKLTRFKTLHVNIIEFNRYQKRSTRSIHEVGFDQNHGIEDAGERAISNDNNYIYLTKTTTRSTQSRFLSKIYTYVSTFFITPLKKLILC